MMSADAKQTEQSSLQRQQSRTKHIGSPGLDIIAGSMYSGKCLAKNTRVMKYDGTIVKVQKIKEGDLLMGDDSTPRTVLATTSGHGKLYKVSPAFGEPYVVNEHHILSLKCCRDFKLKYIKDDVININVVDFMKESKSFQYHYKGYRVRVDFPEQEVPLDPYILGAWLGDGTSSEPAFTSADQEVIDAFKNYFEPMGLMIKHFGKYSYRVTTGQLNGNNWFINVLEELNLRDNKHVPMIYKKNSREVRLQLLAGLLDTDGSFETTKHSYEITQKNIRIAHGIMFLARSLGFVAYMHKVEKHCQYKGEYVYGDYYRISISGTNMCKIPCKC